MVSILSKYDWLFYSQVILVILTSTYVIFREKLNKYDQYLLALPLSLTLGLSIFSASNLISLIFFFEISMSLSKIIYKKTYLQFNNRLYENIRYLFWVIILFSYYISFDTFKFNSVPKNTGVEFTFIVTLLLGVVAIMLLQSFLRRECKSTTLVEHIGYEILTLSIFSMKAILLLVGWSDSIPPKHHVILDVLVMVVVIGGCLLSLRFYKDNSLSKLRSIIRSLIIMSLFPLLIVGEASSWVDMVMYGTLLIIGFITFDTILTVLGKGRVKVIFSFLMISVLSGVAPHGYVYNLFKEIGDNNNQVPVIISVIVIVGTISVISKRVFELSMDKKSS